MKRVWIVFVSTTALLSTRLEAQTAPATLAELAVIASQRLRPVCALSPDAVAVQPTYQTPNIAPSADEFCKVIAQVAGEGESDRFATKNSYGLCAPTWGSYGPPWETAGEKAAASVYATTDFKPMSRVDFLAEGYTVLPATGRDDLLKQAETARARSIQTCCQGQADCEEAMSRVRVTICSSVADTDPTQPDPCMAIAGQYQMSAQEMAQMTLAMNKARGRLFDFSGPGLGGLSNFAGPSARSAPTILTPESVKAATATLTNLGSTFSFSVIPTGPVTGTIVLSPYASEGQPLPTPATLLHEFGHACSAVRRQLIYLRGSKDLIRLSVASFPPRESCTIEAGLTEKVYGPILASAGLDKKVNSCLLDLASQSADPKSSAYIADACPLSKLEEATAEALALTEIAPMFPGAFPDRACAMKPSTQHPSSNDVWVCMVRGDRKTRAALLADKCGARRGAR